jgi:hypothetical protein
MNAEFLCDLVRWEYGEVCETLCIEGVGVVWVGGSLCVRRKEGVSEEGAYFLRQG